MERRTALAYAAATAGTVLAGGSAFAATTGVLGDDGPTKEPVEQISASDDSPSTTSTTLGEPTVMTIIVDDPALAPAGSALVDDNGGNRPAGVSDDAPDLADDNGGDRPEGVSDDGPFDDHGDDDDAYEDHDDEDDDSDDDSDDDGAEDSDDDSDEDHGDDDSDDDD